MCRPCEAADAPGAVKVVWQLVNEYTLMEAERAMLKLLRGLDKHLQHVRQAALASTADTTSQTGAAEPLAVNDAKTMQAPHSNNSKLGLQAGRCSQQSDVSLHPAETDMWNNPIAELASNTDHSQQQLVQHGGRYIVNGSNPDRPQHDVSSQSHMSGAETSSPSSQAVSRRPFVDQEPRLAAVAQSPGPSTDQLTRRETKGAPGDAQSFSGDARSATGDAGAQQPVTFELQQPLAGDTPLPADRPVSFASAAGSRKGKLDYRLSQDDVYSPTPEEVQTLLQQGLLDSQQHQQQQLSSYGGAPASDVASNTQTSLNGMSDAGGSAAVSVFANPSMTAGLPDSPATACLQQEEPHMLSLIAKVQRVQVRSYLMEQPSSLWL